MVDSEPARTSRSFGANASGSPAQPNSPPRKPPWWLGKIDRPRSRGAPRPRARRGGPSRPRTRPRPRSRCGSAPRAARRSRARSASRRRCSARAAGRRERRRPRSAGRTSAGSGRAGRRIRRDRALQAGERDELRHRRPEARRARRCRGCPTMAAERLLAVRQQRRGRRLVRDERAHLLRMLGDQRERVDGPAAAGEEVHRPATEFGDQPVQVVGVLVRRGLRPGRRPTRCGRPRAGRRSRPSGQGSARPGVVNPLAAIGEPIISSAGSALSASASRTS